MRHRNGDGCEPDNQRELSDHGAYVARREQKMACASILSKLNWKRLLRKLKKDELILFKLHYLEQNSPSEIAVLLNEDREEVERKINRLRNKIKSRARAMVKGTRLEKALDQLGILSPNKVEQNKKKVTKKKPRASAKRANAGQKAASASRLRGSRLESVLEKLGFRLAK